MTMNDTKNIFLAGFPSLFSIFSAMETQTLISIISAIVLPFLFFTIGKITDVALQIYFRNRDEKRKQLQGKSK